MLKDIRNNRGTIFTFFLAAYLIISVLGIVLRGFPMLSIMTFYTFIHLGAMWIVLSPSDNKAAEFKESGIKTGIILAWVLLQALQFINVGIMVVAGRFLIPFEIERYLVFSALITGIVYWTDPLGIEHKVAEKRREETPEERRRREEAELDDDIGYIADHFNL